jgi:hypothetical protein
LYVLHVIEYRRNKQRQDQEYEVQRVLGGRQPKKIVETNHI